MQNPVFYRVKLSLGALSWVDLDPMWTIWGPQGVEGTLSGVDLGPMWAICCRTPCFTMNLDVHVGHLVQNTVFYDE